MNLAEQLLTALKAYGVEEIFGIPGDFALPLFKVIEESKLLPLYTLSHEPAVGFAADAASRFHCKPSVAAVTYGAGALNMINPIAAAYAEKSPVIVLSGGPGKADRSTGLLVHHQAKKLSSQLQIFKEVTCAQTILDDTKSAPEHIARVLEHCIGESRPVYIEVPRDIVFEACEPVSKSEGGSRFDPDVLEACADEIIATLHEASSPVLMVGVEIRRYGLEKIVTELAQKLGIPVVTTFMGRGLMVGEDIDFKGTYMGVAGKHALTELVEHSDGLFLLGVLLSDTNFGISEKKIDLRKTILACDGAVSMKFHNYPAIPIRELVAKLNSKLSLKGPQLREPITYPKALQSTDESLTPTDIATAVNDMFDTYGPLPIASDMGDCLFTAMDIENTQLVAPGYYATMGFGVPAGLGIQAATGRRPVIMVGDGAFQMTGMELLNCRRYHWDPIVLVLNNSSWEMLRAFQPESEFNNLDKLDFSALATAIGGRGYTARSKKELLNTLDSAFKDDSCFQLIDIHLPRGVMSDTLTRFVEGITSMREVR